MKHEYIIETREPQLSRLANEYIALANLKSKCSSQLKYDCGDFYILNQNTHINQDEHIDKISCLDFLSNQLSKNQFIKRLIFWDIPIQNKNIFDLNTINNLNEQISLEWTQKILKSFIESTRKNLPILYSSLQSQDQLQIAKTAHYLKSSSLVVGAIDLNIFCEICLEKTKYNEPWTEKFPARLEQLSNLIYNC